MGVGLALPVQSHPEGVPRLLDELVQVVLEHRQGGAQASEGPFQLRLVPGAPLKVGVPDVILRRLGEVGEGDRGILPQGRQGVADEGPDAVVLFGQAGRSHEQGLRTPAGGRHLPAGPALCIPSNPVAHPVHEDAGREGVPGDPAQLGVVDLLEGVDVGQRLNA